MHGAASKALAKGYPNLWTSHLGWTLLGMLLASLGAFGCLIARLGLPGDWPSEIVETGLMGLIVVWLLPFAVRGLIASLKGRQFLMALVILMFGGTFAAGLVNGLLMPGVLDCAPPGFSVPLALALLASWVFMGIMKAPSARRLRRAGPVHPHGGNRTLPAVQSAGAYPRTVHAAPALRRGPEPRKGVGRELRRHSARRAEPGRGHVVGRPVLRRHGLDPRVGDGGGGGFC